GGLRLGIRPVRVGGRVAVLGQEEQQDDRADEGDQRDEEPPSAAVRVVEPPHGDGEARNEDEQGGDAAQETRADPRGEGAGGEIDDREHGLDDDVAQQEKPVLLPPRPALAERVAGEDREIPAHGVPLVGSAGAARADPRARPWGSTGNLGGAPPTVKAGLTATPPDPLGPLAGRPARGIIAARCGRASRAGRRGWPRRPVRHRESPRRRPAPTGPWRRGAGTPGW